MKRYLPAIVLGLLLSLGVCLGQGLFKNPGSQEAFRILSDAFLLPGVLVTGMGLLSWMAGQGQFNGFKYAVYLTWNTFRWGFPRKKTMTYHDFLQENPEKQVSARYMALPGLVFLALSALFLLMYHRVNI